MIKRAYDRKYDTTDEYKADVERTWEFLEDKWTREGATSRLDAVRVVRAYFDYKWTSRGIGEHGGLVCIPSVGISRESLEMPKSASVVSLDSMAAPSAGSDGANTTQLGLEREGKDLLPRSDVALAHERAQNQLALEKCKHLLENFINQPEALNFRDPIEPQTEHASYTSVVEEPMSLTIVLDKLRMNAFASPREVWNACRSIWSNCRSHYPPTNRIRKLCDLAELMFTATWRAQGLNKFSDASDDDSCEAPSRIKSLNDFKQTGSKTAARPPSSVATSAMVGRGRGRVASFKCDVCKRSKKGRCGTETAPKSCLLRPENQSRERQSQIRERVSKLKPMSTKVVVKRKPTESAEQKSTSSKSSGKRKLTEAEQQENCFRRVFDETDPDNFISQFVQHQNKTRVTSHADMTWGNSLHLANEQLRLEVLQNQRLSRYDDQITQQCLPDSSKLASIRKEISHTVTQLHESNVKLCQCNIAMANAPRASHNDYLREQVALEAEIHDLQKKHQEQSRSLQLLVKQTQGNLVRHSPSLDASAGFDHPISVATARVSFDDEPTKAVVQADANDEDILFDFPSIV